MTHTEIEQRFQAVIAEILAIPVAGVPFGDHLEAMAEAERDDGEDAREADER